MDGKRNCGRSAAWRVFVLGLCCHAGWLARADEKLIGTKPSAWQVRHWLNSEPIELQDLKGKVVLVRWWTAPDCPYCKATAPALNEFYREYHRRGLEVIGFYHHKSDEPLRVEDVRKYAQEFGFRFPVAIDADWRTLKQWWLNTGVRGWTSVSFLIDRQGLIRRIHPGGQYVEGDKDYAEMKAKIKELLAESKVWRGIRAGKSGERFRELKKGSPFP